MRYLLPICAGLALFSGTVSAILWRDLHAERQLTAGLRTELSEAKAASARLTLALSQRNNAAMAAPAVVAATESKADAPAPAKPAAPANVPSALQNALASLTQEKELLKDPEYRKARLAQTRMSIARNYPGLAEELGLSEKEADRLFDQLAENQLNMNGELSLISATASNDPAAQQAMMQRQQAMQREGEDAIRNVLGASKYTQWQDYQQTRPARTRVMSMGTMMAQAGAPLNDTQTKALTTMMIAEQQRQRQDSQTLARNLGNPSDPEFRTRLQEESMKRQEESNRRILEAAAPTLSTKQLAALREQFEQDDAMRRASSRLQRERERMQPTPQNGAVVVTAPMIVF
jgi:hypothetical protein